MPQNPPYPTQGNGALGTVTGGRPTAPLATTILTNGVAIVVAVGPLNGGYITNPPNAASQGGIGPENIYVDCINVPGSTDANGNGTTILVQPGQTFSLPATPSGVSWRVNAATAGHQITALIWK